MPQVAVTSLSDTQSQYAVRRRQHLALIKQLRAIGAQADFNLPRITVIGNQSAGKSSLVEAISGISVPRDAGTCTRCPMECRLASSENAWSCQIYIRWEFSRSGKRKREVSEVAFGSLITSKADVELALRRAQSAVLNPGVETAKFLGMSAEQLRAMENKLKFSKNVVCLDLSGPDLTDLAFVDLPGLIQNAEEETVKVVEDMVKSYIKDDCLILVTLPMSDDIENQKAARMAREVDPTGARTIGVLTKPDTLTNGAVKSKELWLDVIEGRRFTTAHGYFCTRLPDDAERARFITPAEAREAEKKFFASVAPWSTSVNRRRFGTQNLVANIATLLSEVIDKILPKLQSESSIQLAECLAELEELPAPITSDPSSFVLNLVLGLTGDVKQLVEGHATTPELVHKNRSTFARYKRDIRDSAPLFLPYVNASESLGAEDTVNAHCLFRFDEDDEVNIDTYTAEGVPSSDAGYIYLEDVRKYVTQALTRELPDNVPYPAKVGLILNSQRFWEERTSRCFNAVKDVFYGYLNSLVTDRFGRYEILATRIRKLVNELLGKRGDVTWDHVATILDLEKIPYTQNHHYLQETKAKYLAMYKDARNGKLQLSTYGASKQVLEGETSGDVVSSPRPISEPTEMPALATATNIPLTRETLRPTKSLPKKRALPHATATVAPAAVPKKTKSSIQPQKAAYSSSEESSSDECSSESYSKPQSHPKKSQKKPVALGHSLFGSKLFSAPKKNTFGWQRRDPSPVPAPEAEPAEEGEGDEHDEDGEEDGEEEDSYKVLATPTQDRMAGTKRPHEHDDEREELERTALSILAKLGYSITAQDLGKLNPPDMYESELELMAEVRAYFQISYKRVIDNIPMIVDHLLLYGFANALQTYLVDGLGLGTPQAAQQCGVYLAEEPHVVRLREELESKKKRLLSVQAELSNFGF